MIGRVIIFSASVLLLNGCLQRHNNYGVVGMPVSSADNTLTVVVVAENEATTYQENGGFRKTTYSTSYWLKQYETATGKLLKKKKLVSAAEVNNIDVACYGAFANTVWLHIDKLRAYDIAGLEETTNEERIAAANGVHKNIFPYGGRLFKPNTQKGYIDFTSDNGVAFRLVLAGLTIMNKEGIVENKDGREPNTHRLLHQDDYGARCDTFNSKVYILAKDSAAAKNTSPAQYSLHEVAYRMKIFSAGYIVKKLGMHNSYSYEDLRLQGEATYLNPCFAKDTYRDAVIRLSKPDGFLLIHQDVLGEKSKALVTRIAATGKKIWETPTGASTKISGSFMSGKYCIIAANKDYMLSPHIGKDALCIIDTETGGVAQAILSN